VTVTGAILAGGDSRRMGKDKALLQYDGRSLLEIIRDSLQPHCGEILVVSRTEKLTSLAEVPGVRLVTDESTQRGPLVGIQAALRRAKGDRVLVVGCDMPAVNSAVLELLLMQADKWDAVVPLIDGHYEPLLACYHRRCLAAIDQVLENARDETRPRSVRAIPSFFDSVRLKALSEEEIQAVDPGLTSLRNINTPEQWRQFREK